MLAVIGLVIPFFGLILLGFVVARLTRTPIEALGWMNTFIVYVALPALFIQLLAKTPIEQLARADYVFGSVFSTYLIFTVMFLGSLAFSRGDVAGSTIRGLAAAYGNIGYMGPGIVLLALGDEAAVPIALIFCFENIMHFTVAPMMMALSGSDHRSRARMLGGVAAGILLHPFVIATAIGVAAAAFHIPIPDPVARLLDYLARAAAPCALFAMGVTLALRPLRRMPLAIGPIAVLKLIIHPALCYVMLSLIGDFPRVWIFAAVLLAALPTATNVYVLAQQYGVWVERASASILVTTVLSVLTITALLYAITNGLLPDDLFLFPTR